MLVPEILTTSIPENMTTSGPWFSVALPRVCREQWGSPPRGTGRMIRMLDRVRIRTLREAGHTLDDIATTVGAGKSSVQRILKEPPIQSPESRRPTSGTKHATVVPHVRGHRPRRSPQAPAPADHPRSTRTIDRGRRIGIDGWPYPRANGAGSRRLTSHVLTRWTSVTPAPRGCHGGSGRESPRVGHRPARPCVEPPPVRQPPWACRRRRNCCGPGRS